MVRLRVARLRGLSCLLLIGCAAPTVSTPSTSPAPGPAVDCAQIAARVGLAVQSVVDAYNVSPGGGTLPTATATPTAKATRSGTPAPGRTVSPASTRTPTPTVPPSGTSGAATPSARAGDASSIQAALDFAGAAVGQGCPSAAMQAGIERGLAAVGAVGPVAEAVRARVIAGLHGQIGNSPGDVRVGPDDDLVLAVATAPAGTIIRLAAGRYPLASTLVLLDSVTLRGAGADATVLASDAPDAAVLAIAGGGAKLADLAVARKPTSTGSGIIIGAGSLVLEGVRVSGAHARGGSGGAGVLMAASSSAASGGDTTLEVTDSDFLENDWAGLAVAGSQTVSIVGSSFTGNGECGLCFLDASGGSVRASTFTDNRVGIYVAGTARPALLSNRIEGGEVGLQVEGKAAPMVEGTRVTGSSRAGIVIAGSATGAIVGTTCSSVPFGIVVGSSAAPTLTDNKCSLAGGK